MRSRFSALALVCSAVFLLGAGAPPAKEALAPDKFVAQAMAKAGDIQAQADVLASLAWPLDGGDPRVREFARKTLVEFAQNGMDAAWKALFVVKPADQADVVRVLVLQFRQLTQGIPAQYFPALDDAIWFGTREARFVAIPEVARFSQQGPFLTIIDAAIEDPEVLPVAIEAFALMRDTRTRFFLERVLHEGKPVTRDRAAFALSRLGAPGRAILKTASRSDNKDVRLIAVRALLPVATVDDLSSLYDYARAHPEDDSATTQAVETATANLEKALEAQRALDAASPAPR